MVLAVVLGDVSGVTAVLAHQVGSSYFSRDLESEADKLGYATLVKAKIKPDGMVSFFQKLQQEQGSTNEGLSWIASHPQTQERTPRGRTSWQPSSVKMLLERAERLGLLE